MTDEGFDPAAFETLVGLEERHFWFRARNRLICSELRRDFPDARSLLEVGCGTGFVLRGIASCRPDLELTGTDLYPDGLEFARRRVDARLEQMDARTIPHEEEFDLIGAFDVIEHISEDELALREMRKALRPGGGLLLTVPQHPWLWSEFDELSRHQRRYRRAELVEKVRDAGFSVRRVTSFVTLLLPALALERLRPRRWRGRSLEEQLSVSVWMNRTFEGVMSLELAMIRRGVSLPAGGSLLLSAVRD
jgi:SAM-dependent methyltransferase